MKKGAVGVLFVLVIVFSSFVYSMSYSIQNEYGEELYFSGESDINFSASNSTSPEVTSCNLSYGGSSYPMSYSNNIFNYTCVDCIYEDFNYVCNNESGDAFQTPANITYSNHHDVSWTHLKPMKSLSNEFKVNSISYIDNDGTTESFEECNFTFENQNYIVNSSALTFTHTFQNNGTFTYSANCTFGSLGAKTFSDNLTKDGEILEVKPYEPQLTPVDPENNPFSDLTSSSGFKLGNYDFDLDGNDDIVVLGSDGLRIYDGDNLSKEPYFDNRIDNTDSLANFVITDFDWDGDGDILIGDQEELFLGKFTSNFNFEWTSIMNSTNIASFGAFDIDGDFEKDILVLNGTSEPWQYTIYANNNFTVPFDKKTLALPETDQCEKFLIFDFNKDFIQDLVCLDKSKDANDVIRIIQRKNLSTNLSSEPFLNHNLGYDASDIFFTDIDSDGEWELGVIHKNISFYKDIGNSFTKLDLPIYNLNVNSFYSHMSLDVLNKDSNNFIYSGNPYFNKVIFDNSTRIKSFFDDATYGISTLNLENDKDSDIITADYISSTDKRLILYNNTINEYKSTTYNNPANVSKNINSKIINFTFERLDNTWNYNNYFFKVNMPSKTYRNDFFDSSQNLKYYMTHENDTYTFNQSSSDYYEINMSLNSYSMILSDSISSINDCPEFNCPFENQTCVISNYCKYGGNLQKTFNTSIINLTYDLNEWNNVIISNQINILSSQTNLISNSIFNNSILYIENSNLNLTNTTFLNSIIISLNSNISLFNTSISGNFTNSNIHNFNSTTSVTNNSNSIINYYNLTTIEFRNSSNNLISIQTNYSNGIDSNSLTTSSISKWWLINNGTNLNYIFDFEPNYFYFDKSEIISNYSETQTIYFNKTNIPNWDYSINGTHQTNFRNYSLLRNISNLTNVQFSIGNNLNLTFLNYINYSNLDLTNLIQNGSNWFYVNKSLVNSSFNLSFKLDTPFYRTFVENASNLEITGDIATALFSIGGNYTFLNDTVFEHNIPPTVNQGDIINISINYTNLNKSINNGTSDCNLTINGINKSFTNLQINDTVDYVLTCSNPELEPITKTGTIASGNIYGFSDKDIYDSFTLHYVNNSINYETVCPNLVLNITNQNGLSNTESCYWNLSSLDETFISINISNGTFEYLGNFSLNDAKKVWSGRDSITNLHKQNDGELIFINSIKSFISGSKINTSYNYFESGLENLDLTSIGNLFKAKINIHNNKTKLEIIN